MGLDFYTTSPSFLKSFRSNVRIGKALATFHPKLYLFEKDDNYCCIIGSSNFTSGGFGKNTELNICIEGEKTDPLFCEVSKFIDEQESRSGEISEPELTDYQAQFERLAASRRRLAKFRASGAAKAKGEAKRAKQAEGREPPDQLNKTWQEFVKVILAQEKRPGLVIQGTKAEPGYLETAERCQTLFAQYGRLSKMPLVDRQFVGGILKVAGWFGAMGNARRFKSRLNNDPGSLDAALDKIPLTEALDRSAFDSFTMNYKWRGSGVGSASRLLAMKRPDLFMCIDSKNRPQVAKAFDLSTSSLQNFDGYWNLLQRIWKCPWWRTGKPKLLLEQRIWKARVALLDSIYYGAGVNDS